MIDITLKEFGHKSYTTAVEIYGELYHLTEKEVRALQVIAKRKAKKSEEAFNEFCKNVIVYSSDCKETALHTMHFRKDGCFSDEFEEGFCDTCANLAFEIL